MLRTLCATAILVLAGATAVQAKIEVTRCSFDSLTIFITRYDDGTPPRAGKAPGVGNRAHIIPDARTGAVVVVEVNTDNIPDTFTTIQPDLFAVHSRHLLDLSGSLVAPTQQSGWCERVPL
jgi:hypothetical protein